MIQTSFKARSRPPRWPSLCILISLSLGLLSCGGATVSTSSSTPAPVTESTSAAATAVAPTHSKTEEITDLTLWNLTQGDRGCYVELVDASDTHFTELGVFELCDRTDLISQVVKIVIEDREVMAESCQGDPECAITEVAPVIIDIQPQ